MARKITYQQAIGEALAQEMERDETVIIMGEDVAGGAGAPGEDDAWGGVLGVTKGLYGKFRRPGDGHADQRIRFYRRRSGRRDGGPPAGRRADVHRFHGRLFRSDLQSGGQIPLYVRRQRPKRRW